MLPWLILKHVPHEGPGLLENEISCRGWPYTVVELYAGGNLPDPAPSSVAGAIVLGGPMNVDETDRFPFLLEERYWLRKILDRQIPVLGICLGAQVMARALGAAVGPNEHKEIGFDPVILSKVGREDPIFYGAPESFDVFHWHGDRFEIPAGALNLASSSRCCHQAFKVHPAAYGFQFHLEITEEMINTWTRNSDEELRAAGTTRDRILGDVRHKLASVHHTASVIFSNYFDRIVSRSRGVS